MPHEKRIPEMEREDYDLGYRFRQRADEVNRNHFNNEVYGFVEGLIKVCKRESEKGKYSVTQDFMIDADGNEKDVLAEVIGKLKRHNLKARVISKHVSSTRNFLHIEINIRW